MMVHSVWIQIGHLGYRNHVHVFLKLINSGSPYTVETYIWLETEICNPTD